MDVQSSKERFIAEGKEDYVGLWQIVNEVKEYCNSENPIEVRRLTLELVSDLLKSGMRAGQSPYSLGGFIPWPEQNVDSVIKRIENEWDALGREPNIPDIVWFDLPQNSG